MRRWLQFRLRTLLVLTAIMCLGLGCWRLCLAYFGPYVEARPTTSGEAAQVRGRILWFHGSKLKGAKVTVLRVLPDGKSEIYQQRRVPAQELGWWSYEVAATLDPISKPGSYRLELGPAAWPSTLQLQELPVVRSELIVHSASDDQ
jgi:hypothetical protein